jgi:hypothetical protein
MTVRELRRELESMEKRGLGDFEVALHDNLDVADLMIISGVYDELDEHEHVFIEAC